MEEIWKGGQGSNWCLEAVSCSSPHPHVWRWMHMITWQNTERRTTVSVNRHPLWMSSKSQTVKSVRVVHCNHASHKQSVHHVSVLSQGSKWWSWSCMCCMFSRRAPVRARGLVHVWIVHHFLSFAILTPTTIFTNRDRLIHEGYIDMLIDITVGKAQV